MKTNKIFLALALVSFACSFSCALRAAPADANAIVWAGESREYTSKPGDRFAHFTFWFTNVSASEVFITSARGSCSCTKAQLSATPWRIPAGTNSPLEITMDLAGKSGTVTKSVTVESTAGRKVLMVTTTVTPASPQAGSSMNDAERVKNMQAALADRQAIFKRAECASCHADPAKGQTDGGQLYAGVCSNCHDSPHRASTVPDLRALKHPTDAEHWRKWITYGRAGSMMPAFVQSEGGPLSQQQIEAIVAHLVKTIPGQLKAAGQPAASAVGR